jgi:hypothetical protein
VLRAASHFSRALVWHFGQCLERQELKGDGLMAALAALIQVSTKCCRSAVLNGEKNAEMKPRQPGSVAFDKCVAMRANDIGHLEGWLIHFLCNFRERFT